MSNPFKRYNPILPFVGNPSHNASNFPSEDTWEEEMKRQLWASSPTGVFHLFSESISIFHIYGHTNFTLKNCITNL